MSNETKKPRRSRTNYERLVKDTAQFCRISIRVLKDQLDPNIADGFTKIEGQIAAYETVLKELRCESANGASND